MEGQATIEGARGMLVMCGLGKPSSRAFCAAVAVGITAYAFKLPDAAFGEEGEMRPFKGVSKAPNATYAHFLAVPLVAGTAVYLFT